MLLNCGVGEDSWVPWTKRRSNQSILKEISPGFSLEGVMLKLKLQYFGHLMGRTDSFEKTLMLGNIEDRRGEGNDRVQDGWMASLIQWTWVWASSRRWWRTGKPDMQQSMGLQRVGHDWVIEQQIMWNKRILLGVIIAPWFHNYIVRDTFWITYDKTLMLGRMEGIAMEQQQNTWWNNTVWGLHLKRLQQTEKKKEKIIDGPSMAKSE